MEQHKGSQCVAVLVGGHQRAQFDGQADTFLAEFVADGRRARGGPVPHGEHRVDTRQQMGHPLRQQLCRWYPQRDVGLANLVLGPGDPLTHGRLALQQRTGDLTDRQPRDQP